MPSSEMRQVQGHASSCCGSLVWAIGDVRWCGKCQRPCEAIPESPENVVPPVHYVHDDDSGQAGDTIA